MQQRLIIVRHGDFDEGSTSLNPTGEQQIANISQKLHDYCSDSNQVALFSSVGPRAIESAEILAKNLGITVEINELFGSHGRENQSRHFPDAMQRIHALAQTKGTIIIVTKGEYANTFIPFYGKEVLDTIFGEQSMPRGKGLVIDNFSKELRVL